MHCISMLYLTEEKIQIDDDTQYITRLLVNKQYVHVTRQFVSKERLKCFIKVHWERYEKKCKVEMRISTVNNGKEEYLGSLFSKMKKAGIISKQRKAWGVKDYYHSKPFNTKNSLTFLTKNKNSLRVNNVHVHPEHANNPSHA